MMQLRFNMPVNEFFNTVNQLPLNRGGSGHQGDLIALIDFLVITGLFNSQFNK